MNTRLRSDKGSFVRSPKGAFDSAAPGFIGSCNVSSTLANNQGHDTTQCVFVNNSTPPTGHDRIAFIFSGGQPGASALTREQLFNGTYTGLTNGAVYTPSTYRPGPIFLCQLVFGTNFTLDFYQTGAAFDAGGGVFLYELYQYTRTATPQPIMECYANYQRFLTRLPTPTSGITPFFANNETFSFVPG